MWSPSYRLAVLVGLAGIAAAFGHVPGAHAEGILETLAAEYKAHGLPFPPADAALQLWETGRSFSSAEDTHISYNLVFVEPSRDKEDYGHWWCGCERIPINKKDPPLTAAAPTIESVLKSEPVDSYFIPDGFPTHPDLALAMQCKVRGWDAMADRLLERTRRHTRVGSRGAAERWPRAERKALALVAWNYWCNRFIEIDADQREILRRLQTLLAGSYDLDTKARRTLLADMEKTLAKSTAPADSLEAAIDRLRDLDFSGGS